MSALTSNAAIQMGVIKKSFPDPNQLISRKVSAVPNAWAAASTQTNTTGVKQITLIPVTYGVIVCFGAPTDAAAVAWLTDATVNADGLQYVFIPASTTRTFTFSSAITRWDMVSTGAGATVVYQEVVL